MKKSMEKYVRAMNELVMSEVTYSQSCGKRVDWHSVFFGTHGASQVAVHDPEVTPRDFEELMRVYRGMMSIFDALAKEGA